jgi:hypothetical protein
LDGDKVGLLVSNGVGKSVGDGVGKSVGDCVGTLVIFTESFGGSVSISSLMVVVTKTTGFFEGFGDGDNVIGIMVG